MVAEGSGTPVMPSRRRETERERETTHKHVGTHAHTYTRTRAPAHARAATLYNELGRVLQPMERPECFASRKSQAENP